MPALDSGREGFNFFISLALEGGARNALELTELTGRNAPESLDGYLRRVADDFYFTPLAS